MTPAYRYICCTRLETVRTTTWKAIFLTSRVPPNRFVFAKQHRNRCEIRQIVLKHRTAPGEPASPGFPLSSGLRETWVERIEGQPHNSNCSFPCSSGDPGTRKAVDRSIREESSSCVEFRCCFGEASMPTLQKKGIGIGDFRFHAGYRFLVGP